MFGIGTFSQVNGITSAVQDFFDPNTAVAVSLFGREYSISVIIAGIIITVAAALVIIGGIQRISKVSQVIVPFMAILYVVFALSVLLLNLNKIPGAVVEIVQGAFGLKAAAGGILGAMIVAMQKGIARGIFSNESGLGSAPIAAAAAKTKDTVRQGLVTMTGTFIDTIIICTMTGLTIIDIRIVERPGSRGRADNQPRVCGRTSDIRFAVRVHIDDLSGVLRVHDHTWLELLQRKMPRVFVEQESEAG